MLLDRKSFVALALALGFSICVSANAATPQFDNLFVFGDSDSDTGAKFSMVGYPAPPYWQGRHSNGPVAVEYLSAALNVASQAGVNNFAVGGALTGYGNRDANVPSTGMLSQFNYYANLSNSHADPNALYFIRGGANDLKICGSSPCSDAQLQTITDHLNTLIGDLSGIGARHFVLVGTLAPQSVATSSAALDALLKSDVSSLHAGGLDITFFDPRPIVKAMRQVGNPYGFTHTDEFDPCYTGSLSGTGGSVCSNPDEYVTWDSIGHLTAHAQEVLGNAMVSSLLAAPVPEPETYALMLAGLGLVGFTALHRRN